MTLFDCNHLAHVIVTWQIQFLLLNRDCFVLLCIKYKPPGAYVQRDDLSEGFFPYEFRGLIFGGAYFRNFTVYLISNSFRDLGEKVYFAGY